MSDAVDNTEESVRPSWLVRTLLMALPLGLAFMVPMSLWIYYKKKHEPEEAGSKLAPMLRQELSAGDFEKYVSVFTNTIGDRGLAQPENLATAAGYVESTMGFANMGYNIQRFPFEAGKFDLVNLVAELPGTTASAGTVLVLADYDAADARGIAALLCLAHAMTGSEHGRTVRFASVVQADAEDAGFNGAAHLAQKFSDADVDVKRILLLRPPPKTLPSSWQGVEMVSFAADLADPKPDVLAMLQRVKEAVEAAADAK